MTERWFTLHYNDGYQIRHRFGDNTVNILDKKLRVIQVTCDEGWCTWEARYDPDYWHASCGEDWVMTDGSPEENSFRYCPSCGCRVRSIHNQHTDEETEQDA